MTPVILASASPRRREFMDNLGIPYTVHIPHIDETPLEGESPSDLVARLSRLKAENVSLSFPDAIVIAADTVVCLDDEILGKPKNREHAFLMLKKLQGRTHCVYTGTTIQKGSDIRNFVEKTEVSFESLPDEVIASYVSSGECDDKAGSYALQGQAMLFISRVEGSVSSVIGLPASEVLKSLLSFGIIPPFKKPGA